MEKSSKIYIAGHNGMVGSAFVRLLTERGYNNLVYKSHQELDLCNQSAVNRFFHEEKPEYVILSAAKVGGIMANMEKPASFLYENLMIQSNIIEASRVYGVKKLLFLGSSCIYPRGAAQPMKEEYLLDGKVEPTNEGYAIAKIAGMKLCEMYNRQYGTNYISVMPCNLYGIGDNWDPMRSHVVPALIRKFHEAKVAQNDKVVIWGTGNARRELLFTEDMVEASLFLLESYSGNEFFNVGSGVDISIKELAELIKDIVGYEGKIEFDTTKPDGMPQKLMDVTKLTNLGWTYSTGLREGLIKTYENFLKENYG